MKESTFTSISIILITNAPLILYPFFTLTLLVLFYFLFKKPPIRFLILIVTFVLFKAITSTDQVKSLLDQIHLKLYTSFFEEISKNFANKTAVFITSITIGTAEVKLSKNIYDLFKQFNLLHVVSISGANFLLIKDTSILTNKFINKKLANFATLIIYIYYINLIGFSNLPALRAFLFYGITLYSELIGKPIRYFNKLLLTITIIGTTNYLLLFNSSFLLSLGFSLFYKTLGLNPFSTIFNNEIKKLSLIFIVCTFIFNSQNPDFIANIIFGVTYPFIFFATFILYILELLSLNTYLIATITNLCVDYIFILLNQLKSAINSTIQNILFLTTIISIFKNSIKFKKNDHLKFSQ